MLEIKGKVHALVTMYQGIVDNVYVYFAEAEALEAFEEYTGMTWPHYLTRLKTEECDQILGDYAGTALFASQIKGIVCRS
jgi:hypothetical protein